jgi:Domain of unknown function (DUF4190)
MSEFKFPCPACGQNILCDTAHAGTEIACPVCNAAIIVPNETAGTVDVSNQTDVPPALPENAATTAQRTSGLAIASLVCSLSSLVICVGWLPGVICGHLAKSRIRRDSSLKGNGLASAGLVIGYLILMLEVGTAAVQVWRISTAVKEGYKNVRQSLATNSIIITQTQSITASNHNLESASSAIIVTNNQQIESADDGWTSDISKVSFPSHPASGKLHGMDFTIKTALFKNGGLRISSTNRMSLEIYRGLGDSIEGQSYEVQFVDDSSANPHVKITWDEDGVAQSATFSKGYGMKLQFGQAKNRRVPAKIYLCLPDDSKSCVAGTFEVRLARQKSDN